MRFEVSAEWMKACGRGDKAKVFPVLHVEQKGPNRLTFVTVDDGTSRGWIVIMEWRDGRFV